MSYYNSEGYADPTAYEAIKNWEEKKMAIHCEAGDIVTVDMKGQQRYFLVMSVKDSNVVQGYLLFDNAADNRIGVTSTQGRMYFDPMFLTYIDSYRVLDYIKTINDTELNGVRNTLLDCLGIGIIEKEVVKEVVKETAVEVTVASEAELIRVTAERDVYKGLLEKMISL